jgi:hemoglobin/transferrin/lactoferrin receptor protein
MKNILMLLAFITTFFNLNAQVITVKDKETKVPLEQVIIKNTETSKIITTNSRGQADISEYKNLEKILIQILGYKPILLSYNDLKGMEFKVFLQSKNLEIDEVVVSVTRSNETVEYSPVRINSISSKDIAISNPQTAADMLANSGEVYVQKSQQGGGSPMIRGFSSNRLLYSVDGIRMNNAIFRSGNIQNVISLDPFAIEKTEVLFGPGSVIYGSDAIGGVMSFQTLDAELSLDDTVYIKGKSVTRMSSANNELTGHFDFNIANKKWAYVTSFSYNKYGDLIMGSNGPDDYLRPFNIQRIDSTDVMVENTNQRVQSPSGYTQMNIMQKLKFKPSKNWMFEYGFHYSETSDYARYDRHIRYKNGLPRYGEWNYGPQKWLMHNLTVNHFGKTPVYDHAILRIAHQSFGESRISRDFNKNDRETKTEQVYANSANADFSKKLGKKNKLFYGVEYVQNEVYSTGINTDISTGLITDAPARYPRATWKSYGAYLTNHYTISDKFVLQGGLRYSLFDLAAKYDTTFYAFNFTEGQINNGALTGSIGLNFHPNKSLAIATNLSTGFRSPNVDDMGKVFDSEPGAVVVPNNNLESEYVYNADLSVTKLFGEQIKLNVTGFYTVLENALVRRDFNLNGEDSIMYAGELSQVQAIQNAASATIYGVQAGIKINFFDGFQFSSNINYQKGIEELDDGSTSRSRHAAPLFGTTMLSYTKSNLSLRVYANYNGEVKFENLPVSEQGKGYLYAKDENGDPYSPFWYTVNFKAMYSFTNQLSISGGVENLTDIRYRPYSSGMAGPGRNFILSLRANF